MILSPWWLLFAGLILGSLSVVSVVALLRIFRRSTGPLLVLAPSSRGATSADVVAELEEQLEATDWTHAYVATSTWVVRVYPSVSGGRCLAIGTHVTHHRTDFELMQAIRTRLGVDQRPALRVLEGGGR